MPLKYQLRDFIVKRKKKLKRVLKMKRFVGVGSSIFRNTPKSEFLIFSSLPIAIFAPATRFTAAPTKILAKAEAFK